MDFRPPKNRQVNLCLKSWGGTLCYIFLGPVLMNRNDREPQFLDKRRAAKLLKLQAAKENRSCTLRRCVTRCSSKGGHWRLLGEKWIWMRILSWILNLDDVILFFLSMCFFFFFFLNTVCFGMSPFGQGLNVGECHRWCYGHLGHGPNLRTFQESSVYIHIYIYIYMIYLYIYIHSCIALWMEEIWHQLVDDWSH